jgi:hypothetical protein
MKWALVVGGFLVVSAMPVQAQSIGLAGGSLNRESRLPSRPVAQFRSEVVSGTEQDFVLTTYASYDQALVAGRTELMVMPKSLGEVAREYAREAKPKPKFAFEQNEYGQAMVTRR